MVTVLLRVIIIVIIVQDLGANGLLGDPFPAGDIALQLGGRGDGERGSKGRPDDGDRSCLRTGGWRSKEENYELGGSKEEIFMVAQRPWEGGITQPSHRHRGRSRGKCRSEGGEEHQTLSEK
jgi:hypothetical protein